MTPDPVSAEGVVGDVEALAQVIAENAPNEDGFVGEHTLDGFEVFEQDLIRTLARGILASDWLAGVVAAARAEERERIAQAIEAERDELADETAYTIEVTLHDGTEEQAEALLDGIAEFVYSKDRIQTLVSAGADPWSKGMTKAANIARAAREDARAGTSGGSDE